MFPILLFLFIFVPLAELFCFLRIGSQIGLPATFAIIVITGILGAWLARVQGLRTLSKFQRSMAEGRLPHEEVIDGVLILVAGAVLLTPGFLTDGIGFLLLVPAFRTEIRRRLGHHLKSRIEIMNPVSSMMDQGFGPDESAAPKVVKGRVVEGESDK